MSDSVDDRYTDFDGNPLGTDDVEALKRLEERVHGAPAEGWRPEPNDVVTGRVVEIDEGSSEYGCYPLLTISRPNGENVAVHCFHTVLQNRVEKLVEKGIIKEDVLISIRYVGQEESTKKGMSGPHIYRVAVQR